MRVTGMSVTSMISPMPVCTSTRLAYVSFRPIKYAREWLFGPYGIAHSYAADVTPAIVPDHQVTVNTNATIDSGRSSTIAPKSSHDCGSPSGVNVRRSQPAPDATEA